MRAASIRHFLFIGMVLHLGLAVACGTKPATPGPAEDVLAPAFGPKDVGTPDAAVDGPRDATATDAAKDATPADAAPVDAVVKADAGEVADVEPGETEEDMGSACGDGACSADEDCSACPEDCGDCAPGCGDGTCKGGETCKDCAKDCGICPVPCGDGTCKDGETCKDCPKDCGACPVPCGDGACKDGETCQDCAKDCGVCPVPCGDGACKGGESCVDCPADCGTCPAVCGDKTCSKTETCKTCPGDCGACKVICGDAVCSVDVENCQTCAADCGKCPGVCDPLTSTPCAAAEQCYVTQAPPACIAAGSLALGVACKALNECKKGMLCISSVCRSICDTSGKGGAPPCPTSGVCSSLQLDDKPVGYNLGACFGGAVCNLLSNSGCGTGQMCVAFETGKECAKAGAMGPGQACTSNFDCTANTLCVVVGPGGKQQCRPRCHANGGSPGCASGTCFTVILDKTNKPAPDSLGVCN